MKRSNYIHVRCDEKTKERLIRSIKAFNYLTQADVIEQAVLEFYEKYHVEEHLKLNEEE